MTLLEDVERILQERASEVCIKGKNCERGYLLDGNTTDKYGQRVDFWLASVSGLYSVCALQSCLDELSAGFREVEHREVFRQEGDHVYFGRVQLVEEISSVEVEWLRKQGNGETCGDVSWRRITLRLFPDEEYVNKAIDRNLQMQYGCSVAYLERNRVEQELRKVA